MEAGRATLRVPGESGRELRERRQEYIDQGRNMLLTAARRALSELAETYEEPESYMVTGINREHILDQLQEAIDSATRGISDTERPITIQFIDWVLDRPPTRMRHWDPRTAVLYQDAEEAAQDICTAAVARIIRNRTLTRVQREIALRALNQAMPGEQEVVGTVPRRTQ